MIIAALLLICFIHLYRLLWQYMIWEIRDYSVSVSCGEEQWSLIYVPSCSIELYKGTLHLDRSIKVRSQSYQSRWWKEGKSSQQAMLSQPNGSYNAAEQKRERQRPSEWDRESKMLLLLYGFDWLCIFFLKLFIEDRFIIPICQASKDFN